MQLSDFQKQIVGTILTGETCHIETFFEKYCDFDRENCWLAGHTFEGREFPHQDGMSIVTDETKSHLRLKDFVAVCNKLEEAKLICYIPYYKDSLYPVGRMDNQRSPARTLLVLFNAFDKREIVPLPDLEEFVQAGYKTQEEIRREDEKKKICKMKLLTGRNRSHSLRRLQYSQSLPQLRR